MSKMKSTASKPASKPAKGAPPLRKRATAAPRPSLESQVRSILAWLERHASKRFRADMESRYGIVTDNALGVPVGVLMKHAKALGRDHDLAAALWDTGCYEARMLAAMIDDPALVTAAQMDRWCRDFDNWGICDTVCFKLFDQTPHAYRKAAAWAKREAEFVKRTGFVLMACLALHDKAAPDGRFLPFLPLIERGAADDRNFVKKGVSWALRSIGRRTPGLRAPSLALAERLARSEDPARRWVGKDTLRDLGRAKPRPGRRAK